MLTLCVRAQPVPPPPPRGRGARARHALAAGVLLALGLASAPLHAAEYVATPTSPPPRDSLRRWAAEANARFKANPGDSVGGGNLRAYDLVAQISRRMLRSYGPHGLAQAPVLKPLLDSLGLDTDVVIDPLQPAFILVMVRNPYRFSANSVGYLYWWYRAEDFRMQGVVFRGGKEPASRVWWTGHRDQPYEWAVVDHDRGNGPAHFTLFRLNPEGTQWSIAQSDEGREPVLGEPGEAVFADINHDGLPELVQWSVPKTDSLFVPCPDCPKLTVEKTFVERQTGFTLHDSRVLPSPYATLVAFVRDLIESRRADAAKLVGDPGLVNRGIAAGWGVSRKPGTWRVEYYEQDERWPRWLALRLDGPQGVKRYIVHFTQVAGHWIIQQWAEPQPVAPKSAPHSGPGAR